MSSRVQPDPLTSEGFLGILNSIPGDTKKVARELRDEAKEKLAMGIDPQEFKKEVKLKSEEETTNNFESIAREWHLKFRSTWTKSHGDRILLRLQADIFPYLGKKPISTITAPELLRAIRHIEDRGALETAHRTLQNCGKVFRYAIATGRAERDISLDLRGAIPPVKSKHHASIIEPDKVGALLRAMDGYEGFFPTACALKIAPLVFVRPGELRQAEWEEFDFIDSLWRIPAGRMKMRTPHLVPLSKQVLAILEELKPITGGGRFLFPSIRSQNRPMSNNTVNSALRRLGYSKEEMTGHGFRSMASTLLNEKGWNGDAIERQLAHAERSKVRAAYNFAEFLPERRKMMQAWADYLDELRRRVAG